MRFVRLPYAVAILTVACALAAAVAVVGPTLPGKLRRVELAPEDSRPNVHLRQPTLPPVKLEWSFWIEGYVRAVVERRDAPDARWKIIGSYPWQPPCRRATLV
ncbi:MAG TPA: hypothetical protein VFJ90_09560, partial [Candidatus Didemnitutus sp.]|nr:hypothetical protein [Candidatus Didemnitutus sp.]